MHETVAAVNTQVCVHVKQATTQSAAFTCVGRKQALCLLENIIMLVQ